MKECVKTTQGADRWFIHSLELVITSQPCELILHISLRNVTNAKDLLINLNNLRKSSPRSLALGYLHNGE